MQKYKHDELKHLADSFFNEPGQGVDERVKRERMYIAFRARLILDLRVEGGSNEGVVYGRLKVS